MRIACVGGGPGGLFFALLVKQANPSHVVTVFERNRREDTFGFGVVFSDATLASLAAADPILADRLSTVGEHWDQITVRLKGEEFTCAGNGMAAITRKELLVLLAERAIEAGVEIRWEYEIDTLDEVADFDLVVVADGANSKIRAELASTVEPTIAIAQAKFIWFGTTYRFEGLTFLFEESPHGVFAVHGYPISPDVGTFIVETDEDTWRASGLDEFDTQQPGGPSDERSRRYLEDLFAGQIEGHAVLANNSRWGNFRTVRNASWRCKNAVLIGDAAHTAHFSVGSGTKMAMEDAAALVEKLVAHPLDLRRALEAHEADRRPEIDRIQGAAGPSLSWWEHFGDYYRTLPPEQFAFHFLTRAIGYGRIRARDPEFVASVHRWWQDRHGDVNPLSGEVALGSAGVASRQANVRAVSGSAMVADFANGLSLPLYPWPSPDSPRPWGLLVTPDSSATDCLTPDRIDHRTVSGDARPALVAVVGGTPHARRATCEELRLSCDLPLLLVDDEFSEDRALTVILSGRADLVGVRSVIEATSGA